MELLDSDTLSSLLLTFRYYELTNYASTCQRLYTLIDGKFWSLKASKDFKNQGLTTRDQYFKAFMTVGYKDFKGEDYLTRYLELIEFTEIWTLAKPRLYVQGFEECFEGYEVDCLYLKIGVIAKSKVAGYGLLNLLWTLKRYRVELSVHRAEMMIDESRENQFTLTDLLKEIVSAESCFGSIFDLGEPIKSKIRARNPETGRMEDSEVRNDLHKMEIYTFPRIEDEVWGHMNFTELDECFDLPTLV